MIDGINVFNEKEIHSALKTYYCKDKSCHEIAVGPYIADAVIGDRIYEIQTGGFYPLRKKLEYYMSSTDMKVDIVYPMALQKDLVWIDASTGEASKPRRSPKRARSIELLKQAYWIREHLGNERLSIHILYYSLCEYRMLDGYSKDRKKGSTLVRRELLDIVSEEKYSGVRDYAQMVPAELPEVFCAKDFSKLSRLRGKACYGALKIYEQLGIVEAAHKIGRTQYYRQIGVG